MLLDFLNTMEIYSLITWDSASSPPSCFNLLRQTTSMQFCAKIILNDNGVRTSQLGSQGC